MKSPLPSCCALLAAVSVWAAAASASAQSSVAEQWTLLARDPPTAGGLSGLLVPSPALCAQPPVPALRPVPKAFKPFGPPALVQQAPPAILLAALRRFRGPAVFLGLRTSSRLGAPFWPSGLTLRSSCSVGDGIGTVRPLLRRAKNAARPSLCSCRRSRPFGMVAAMLQPPRHQSLHR